MEYNTTREKMAIPKYGRNVQKMVQNVKGIEDREARTYAAQRIVTVMASMNPHIKESSDFEHTLWDHLFIIAGFQLDVDSPFPPPEEKNVMAKPKRLAYSEDHIRYKHYGMHLEKMINHAVGIEDGPEKEELVRLIANQMKKSYLNWNRDTVSDELIIAQLDILSNGKLKLKEDDKLIATGEIILTNRPPKKKKNNPKKFNLTKKRNFSRKSY